MTRPAYAADGDGLRLYIRVTPRARRSGFSGAVTDAEGAEWLAVRLAAPPVDGAANKALIEFLAHALGVPRSAVALVSGRTSRFKVVRISGLVPEALAERL